jgi:LCP family protein required for cell wall assembly
MKRKDSLARKGMKVLCVLLGITFGVMLAITLLFRQALDQIRFIPSQSAEDSSVLAVFSGVSLGFSDTEQIGGPHSNLVNILLIGQDAREGEEQARSDSMILCTYNKSTQELTMTSFLRDLYVPIPGHGSNRINAAYAFGGTSLLKKTIDQNFAVAIDGCIEVDFAHFAEIIDQLGGVQIELRQDEANVINQQAGSSLTEGVQQLDGFQALTYSRIRSLDIDGDFSRTNRQRKVINALAESLRGSSITELTPVIGNILPMLTTDMNRGQLFLYAIEILPHLSELDIHSQNIPAEGTFAEKTIDGMSVLDADLNAQRQYLKATLVK